MIAGGLPADKKVAELEKDISLRSFLFKSCQWLEVVIENNLQDPNELLVKQVILCHLKLDSSSLTSSDLLKLDGMFGGCSDLQLKNEASSQLLFLISNLPEVDSRRQNVILLQSLCYEKGVTRTSNQVFSALINRRKLVAHLYLRSIDFNAVKEEYGTLLSSSDMQSNLVQTVLRGATYLNRLLLPVQIQALPEPKPSLVDLFALSSPSLDITIWSLKLTPEKNRFKLLRQFVAASFKDLCQSGGGDASESASLTSSDMEAFLVAVLSSSPQPKGLPAHQSFSSPLQRDFYQAAVESRSTVVSKMDHVQHRKTLRNGKNVLRLKGQEPPAEILAEIGKYFGQVGDPYMAVFYLGAVEDKLKTVSHGGGLIRGEGNTLLGAPNGSAMTSQEAKELLDLLTESRGSKEEFENNYEEATRLFTLANTASSLYKAAKLIVTSTNADQSQGTQMDEYQRANELCSQASAMQPDDDLSEQLSSLHIEINDALMELDSQINKDDTAENDTLAIMNNTPLNQTQNSVYGTPSEFATSFNRRSYFSPSSKQVSF